MEACLQTTSFSIQDTCILAAYLFPTNFPLRQGWITDYWLYSSHIDRPIYPQQGTYVSEHSRQNRTA